MSTRKKILEERTEDHHSRENRCKNKQIKASKKEKSDSSRFWRREGRRIKRIVYYGPQKSKEWHKSRKFRITGSKASCVHDKDGFKDEEETADLICGRKKEEMNESMLRGVLCEDGVRKWYEKTRKVKVTEVGFAYMEGKPYIGVSPDGLVGEDGLIEIKCPDKLYWPLKAREKAAKRGLDIWWTREGGYSRPKHIYASHYTQMQMQMAIMERKWCDYVVYSKAEDLVYVERVEFNEFYWRTLFPDLCDFVKKYLKEYKCYIPRKFRTRT